MSNTIYIIKNTENDKVYIGQTIHYDIRYNEHFRNYKKKNQHLYYAMRKYGENKFSMNPICSVLDLDNLDYLEEYFIKEYDSFNNGYNMTSGGKSIRGYKHSEETKRKMSKSKLGKKRSEETKRKMSIGQKGNKHSEETKRKMSIQRSGENHHMYGKKHSEETKRMIGLSQKGKNISEETKRKMSKSKLGKGNNKFKGYYHTPFGILCSSLEINTYTDLISPHHICNWCKGNNKITKRAVNDSKYLTKDMIGKTFREIGFWFESV